MKSSADPHCFITAPKDGIKPPGGRRSTKRTERPPAVISHYSYLDNRACGKEVLFHRAVPWCLRGQCSHSGRLYPESGGLHKDAVQLCRHGALEYQEPQSAHETAQKNEETSASSEQVKTWPEY